MSPVNMSYGRNTAMSTVAVYVRVLVHTAWDSSREEARLCRYLFAPHDASGLVDGPVVVPEDREGGAGDFTSFSLAR